MACLPSVLVGLPPSQGMFSTCVTITHKHRALRPCVCPAWRLRGAQSSPRSLPYPLAPGAVSLPVRMRAPGCRGRNVCRCSSLCDFYMLPPALSLGHSVPLSAFVSTCNLECKVCDDFLFYYIIFSKTAIKIRSQKNQTETEPTY